jgi:hypothetical protein
MSLREIMVTSKDIRTEIQDLIKVKNVRAVLLGKSAGYPFTASMNWPRTDGVLIQVDMRTNGNEISAIIDTGSQLDIVRADIAAKKVQRAVDMEQVTMMNDANGGQGELRGRIEDVEFFCGAAVTVADLWVSQQAPFGLLLGRPWQRGNLVSIDERDEGTYLVFKDRKTRQPRYELLAVPYDGPPIYQNQYQSFAYTVCKNSSQPVCIPSMQPYSVPWMREQARKLGRASRPITLNCIRSNKNQRPFVEFDKLWSDEIRDRGYGRTISRAFEVKVLLVRVVLEVFSVLGTFLWNYRRISGNSSQRYEVYKEGGGKRALPIPPLPEATSLMSLSQPLLDHMAAPDVMRLVPPLVENVQYLARAQYGDPPMPVVPLNASGPIATLEESICRQWQRSVAGLPLDVDPTFSAAPQSEYYGSVVLPNGQRLHRSAGFNVFRIFRDRSTGQPFTMSCHEFTFHVSTPDDPQRIWDLELCYPSDERLSAAMATLPSIEGQAPLSYPVHVTK